MRSMAIPIQPCVVILRLNEFENHGNGLDRKIKGSLSREVWVSKPSHVSDSYSPQRMNGRPEGNSGVFLLPGEIHSILL